MTKKEDEIKKEERRRSTFMGRVTSVLDQGGQPAFEDTTKSSAEERRKEATLNVLISEVAKSPLSTLSLAEEPAIRDFLVDLLVDDVELARCLHIVAILAVCWNPDDGGHPARARRAHLGLASENIAALFFGKLPRRMNGTLLHVASGSGSSMYLVELTLHIMALCATSTKKIQGKDDEEKNNLLAAPFKREMLSNFWEKHPQLLDLADTDGHTAFSRAAEVDDGHTCQLLACLRRKAIKECGGERSLKSVRHVECD